MSVVKRQRERKKAEKAALKREEKDQRRAESSSGQAVATRDDLEAYGIVSPTDAESEDD